MKTDAVKQIASDYSLDALKIVEQQLLNGEIPSTPIPGEDEGEKLTHVLSAIWVLETMETEKITLVQALRKMAGRVRNSIQPD
jgi:hypothetical protein